MRGRRGRYTAWILGGLSVSAVLVLVVVLVWGTRHSHKALRLSTPAAEIRHGSYSVANVANACDAIDTATPGKWASQPGVPTHHEDKDLDGPWDCEIEYTAPGGEHGTIKAAYRFSFQIASGRDEAAALYTIDERTSKGMTGTGHTFDELPGIGTKAFQHTRLVPPSGLSHGSGWVRIGVLDDNLTFDISFEVDSDTIDVADMGRTGEQQARAVLGKLRAH